jgi:acid phosphatase
LTDEQSMLGELTDTGRATTLALGERLRKQYIEEYGYFIDHAQHANCRSIDFLPPNPTAATTFFRSTNMPRTLESLQQIITGLYPSPVRGEWVPKVFIRYVIPLTCSSLTSCRNPSDETLLPNTFTCARLRQLDREFAIKAARDWNKELEPLDAKLSKFIGGRAIRVVSSLCPLGDVTYADQDGKPRLSGIEDTVRTFSIEVCTDVVDPGGGSQWRTRTRRIQGQGYAPDH